MRRFIITWGPWLIATAVFVVLFCVYFLLRRSRKPVGPAVPVVSRCKTSGPGMRRIGRFEFQLDIPAERFTIRDFASDAPSGPYGFGIKPSNSASLLDISWDPTAGMEGMMPALDPALNFSGPVENRKILDDEGNSVGEDSWGYWDNEEFWRRVRLRGSIVARYGSINSGEIARYGSVHEEDAKLFDQVINSVCIEPSLGDGAKAGGPP
jgi:hypothetical protein